MAEEKKPTETKVKKLADPVTASIDEATQKMIQRSHELGIETAFDRALTLKPCNIGTQGICCKNCGMGPCRLPLPKSGIEGEDTRKGICGATPNTIAARNFIRMIAGGELRIRITGVRWPKYLCPPPEKKPMRIRSRITGS